jgi:hypothetical protein
MILVCCGAPPSYEAARFERMNGQGPATPRAPIKSVALILSKEKHEIHVVRHPIG